MGGSNSSNVHQQTPVSGGGEGRDETLDILQQVIHKYSSEAPLIAQPSPIQSYNQQVLPQQNVPMPGHNVHMTTEGSITVSAAMARLHQEQSSTMMSSATALPPNSPKEKLIIADHFDEINVQTQNGVYKYQCKTCANMFKSRHALYEHVNTHLGRKPFSCDTCGLTFAHHSTLYNHKRNKHTFSSKAEKEALFKFKCPQCDKRFEFPSALDRHFAKYPEHSIKREIASPEALQDSSTVSTQEPMQPVFNERLPPIQSMAQPIASSVASSLSGIMEQSQSSYMSSSSITLVPENSGTGSTVQSGNLYNPQYPDQGPIEQSTNEMNST